MAYVVAVDTGGTFTDFVAFDTERKSYVSSKSLTTYDDLVKGIADCATKAKITIRDAQSFRFGTTLVINTLIQRTGPRIALITTRGFRDILEMGRGNRSRPYDLRYRRHPPLVERNLIFEAAERMSADGLELAPLDLDELDQIAREIQAAVPTIEAVAISFLNSYRNDEHECIAAEHLRKRLPNKYITTGTGLSREWYEYERTSTAVANAYVGPQLNHYLARLENWLRAQRYAKPFFMMASHGGAFAADRARREPIMLIESGPVGGCIAAAAYAETLHLPKMVAFDMGGTTAKCCVVADGQFEVQSPYFVGGAEYGFPIRGSVLDIVEVGAGGGSIAALDPQGRLSIGPRSAGSEPGPVCYGRGGREVTITDANLVLGRIGVELVGGEMRLDAGAAIRAMADTIAGPMGLDGDDAVQRAAQGIVDIGVLTMADAIKQVTIQKGLDPRQFSLIAYGGGGPLHAADLARELAIFEVIIPPDPGVFSSVGMLMADGRLSEQSMFMRALAPDALPQLEEVYRVMERRLERMIVQEIGQGEVRFERHADLKYKGQGHALRISIADARTASQIRSAFNNAYRRRYGHANADAPIDIMQLASTATVCMDKPEIIPHIIEAEVAKAARHRRVYFREFGQVETAIYSRSELPVGSVIRGPAVVEEYGSSTVVPPGDQLTVGKYGELRITIGRRTEIPSKDALPENK